MKRLFIFLVLVYSVISGKSQEVDYLNNGNNWLSFPPNNSIRESFKQYGSFLSETELIPQCKKDAIVIYCNTSALISFHALDTCSCYSKELIFANDSLFRSRGGLRQMIIRIKVDSVLLVNIGDDLVDADWFLNIGHLLIDDTTHLKKDTSYIASVRIGYDLDEIVWNRFYSSNVVIINPDIWHLKFVCSFVLRTEDHKDAYDFNVALLKRAIKECDSRK